jgi:hypothetical protein
MTWEDRFLRLGGWWTLISAFSLLPLGVINVWNRHAWWLDQMWNTWLVLGFAGACLLWVCWFIAWMGVL